MSIEFARRSGSKNTPNPESTGVKPSIFFSTIRTVESVAYGQGEWVACTTDEISLWKRFEGDHLVSPSVRAKYDMSDLLLSRIPEAYVQLHESCLTRMTFSGPRIVRMDRFELWLVTSPCRGHVIIKETPTSGDPGR